MDHKIQVLEVSGSNVTSVAEHVVMNILLLVRNFVPAHEMIERGDWNVSEIARDAFDIEGKVIGTIGAGRIGYRVLQRLVPFDPKELLYFDYTPLSSGKTRCLSLLLDLDNIPQKLPGQSRLVESRTSTISYHNVISSPLTVHSTRALVHSSTQSFSHILNRAHGSSTPLEGPSVTRWQWPTLLPLVNSADMLEMFGTFSLLPKIIFGVV